MGYRQFSDTELASLFLECNSNRVAIRDELFGRYYERFDQRIRAVLYTCGLPYSPAEFYYNEIFVDIYHQIFDLSEFGEILGKYKPERGEFANWFMNYVVVNRVKDWLKKVDKPTGLKNIERLKENTGHENRYVSLDKYTDIIPAETEPSDRAEPGDICPAIQQLPVGLRLMLRLLFLAYGDVPEIELAHLAAEIHSPVAVIKDKLEHIRRELKESPKYEEGEQIDLTLDCLARQEEHWQRQIRRLESEMEAVFPGQEIPAGAPGIRPPHHHPAPAHPYQLAPRVELAGNGGGQG